MNEWPLRSDAFALRDINSSSLAATSARARRSSARSVRLPTHDRLFVRFISFSFESLVALLTSRAEIYPEISRKCSSGGERVALNPVIRQELVLVKHVVFHLVIAFKHRLSLISLGTLFVCCSTFSCRFMVLFGETQRVGDSNRIDPLCIDTGDRWES